MKFIEEKLQILNSREQLIKTVAKQTGKSEKEVIPVVDEAIERTAFENINFLD